MYIYNRYVPSGTMVFFFFNKTCVIFGGGMPECVCGSRRTTLVVAFLLYYVGPWDQTQLVVLASGTFTDWAVSSAGSCACCSIRSLGESLDVWITTYLHKRKTACPVLEDVGLDAYKLFRSETFDRNKMILRSWAAPGCTVVRMSPLSCGYWFTVHILEHTGFCAIRVGGKSNFCISEKEKAK